LRLSLFDLPSGAPALPGNRVVYDVGRGDAWFGAVAVEEHALVWELAEYGADGARLSEQVDLDRSTGWLMRCDRVDFPPGGVADWHTHPGPGIRYLLFGSIRIETDEGAQDYRPGDAWFESGPEPVLATASETEQTAFVRVLLLPREWEGRRTIRYVDSVDEEKRNVQRASVFLEQAIDL
jgi:quercetin dioxygenase-like cupin family protein